MSEEEKETIKYIESGIDTYIEKTKVTKIVISEEQAKILLNLIEKLEKELEQEKEKNQKLKIQLELEKIDNKYNQEEAYEEMIPRYKIKEILKQLDNKDYSSPDEIQLLIKSILNSLYGRSVDND